MPDNALIESGQGNIEFESEITVACIEGYETQDALVVTCQADKTWSASPMCVIMNCPTFTVPDNAVIEDGAGNTEFDSSITVACMVGYETEDALVVTCQADKTWSASPLCVIMNCPSFTVPDNAVIEDGAGNTEFDSNITVACMAGYETEDVLVVTCQADKTWSASPSCSVIQCATYVPPDNAFIITGDGNTDFGDIITVSCDDGYETNDAAAVECRLNKTWSDSPKCSKVDCGTYEITNGIVGSPETTFGSNVTLTCHNGFLLQGSNLITCLATGLWDDSPNCTIVDCGELPNDANGKWMFTGTKYNDTASIDCNVGTKLVDNPDANMFCSEDGTWVGTLYCVLNDCGDLNIFENGNIIYLNGTTTYLSMVQITCDSGFHVFNGENTATCGKEGNWSTEPGCTNVGTVSVGSSCYDFTEGETEQITCAIAVVGWGTSGIFAVSDDGQINPIITITQSGGTFNNQSMLQHVTLNPDSVLSADVASIVVDFTTVLDTDAGQYMCGAVVGDFESAGENNSNRDNFIIFIQGNPILVIDNTLLQDNTQAVIQCTFESDMDSLQSLQIQIKYKNESTFVDISDQTTTTTSESEPPCYMIYTVSATFIATDAHHEADVKCVATLTDTIELTSNVGTLTLVMPADCGDAPADANGVWTYTGTKHNDTASITCNVGTELDTISDAYLVCSENGIWVGTVDCVPIDCGEFHTPANSVVSYTNGTTYLSVVLISCDDGFNLFNNEDTVICSHEGNWSGNPGCTNVGTVTVGSSCYSFLEGETGQITCDIAVVGWGTSGIFAISADTAQMNPIIVITQTDSMFNTTSTLMHVSLNSNSVLSADIASLVVDFTPVSATDAGQYTCGAVVGNFESAGQTNSNLRDFAIFIQALTIEAPTQLYESLVATVTCSAEISRDSLGELYVQTKALNDDQFVTVTESVTATTTSKDCSDLVTKIWSFSADSVENGTDVQCLIDYNSEASKSSDSVTMYKATSYVTMDSPAYNFEIGTTESIVCDILNIVGMHSIKLTRSAAEPETVLEITNLADGTPSVTSNFDNIQVDMEMTTYKDKGAHVVILFTPVKCSEADADSNESVYICAALDINSVVIKSDASTITISKLPEVVLDFPVQIREDRWTLSIGCDAVLGLPRRDLTFLLKRADESTFSPYIPEVLNPRELRWNITNSDDGNDCVENVRYEFDMDTVAEVWQDTEIRCAVGYGTDDEVMSEIGVFQVVPKIVCDGLPENTFVAHPYDCTHVVQCTGEANKDGEWAYVHPTTCSNGDCWISGSLNEPECGITTTTTSTTPTPSTTPAPGTPYITCPTDVQAVNVGQSAEFECDLRDIVKVTQLVITNTAGDEIHNETNAQGIVGDVSVSDGVSIVNINAISTVLMASFGNVFCELGDTYTIQINGVTEDDINLHVLADPGDVSIMMPSVVITNGRTEITCDAGVGVDIEGRPVAILSIEHKLDGQAEFVPVNTGLNTSVNYENCQNTETLSFVFYADQTWANALVRCVLRSVNSSEITSASVESGVTLTDANVFFEQTEVSQLIDEAVILKCVANGIDGLAKLEITRDETRVSIASLLADGSTSSVDGVTVVTDKTDISDNDGTLEIQFTATCETKGSYYCTATGSDSPPETLASVTVTRKPKIESLSLSIGWIENRYQFKEHTTNCVAEIGYPLRTVYLEANIGGQVQQLASKTPTNDAEQNCGNVVTLTYAHPDLINSTWEGATITCRVSGGDDQPDVEVSDDVHVVTDTFCDDEQPGDSNKLEHPYACSAWLTCNRDDGTLSTCTTADPCHAVPFPVCTPPQCYDWSSLQCYTQSTTTSTTTTTITTTTPAPGTPFITCTANLNTVYDGESAQFECTLRDIAVMSMLKITNQDGIDSYNEADDKGLPTTLTDGVSQVTINDNNTLLTFTFTNVNCEQVGVYTIQINNMTSDDVTLQLKAKEMTPTLTLPSDIKANSLTEIPCIGEVGLNAEGDIIAELSYEVQFPDDTAFQTYSDGVNNTLEDENCNPTEKLVLTFYPDATWNSASIRCVSTNVDSGDRMMSTYSTIMLQTADVLFENPQLSHFIGETVTMRCLVSNVADLERIAISRGDARTNVAIFMSDGSTTNAEGVTTIPDNTHIMTDSTSSLEIEFIGECGDKGQYYCNAVGSITPPETQAILEIKRQPTIQSFDLSINWVDKRYQYAEQPTICVVELGYPKGNVYLESNKDGDFQELSVKYDEIDDECSSVATVQYGYGPLMDMSWNGKMIRCRVDNPDVLDYGETVSETKTVNVIPETFCSGKEPESKVIHPDACYAWLTCKTDAQNVDTCSNTNCYAVPLALCATNECLDIPSQTCGTVTTTTSTTTTTTTTTTTAPGSPFIQCSDVMSPTGGNENITCSLNNIARVEGDSIKVMKGDTEILDTLTASSGISYDVAPSLIIVVEGTTVQLQFGPLLCDQGETYTVQYLSDSGADPVQDSGSLTITADAQAPSISTSPAKFYRGQEIVIMCIGNLGSPEGTTDIELKSRSSADGTYLAVAITSSTMFNMDVCANDKTLSHSLYVTDNNAGSQYICETTMADGITFISDALTVALAEPVISFTDSSTNPEIGNSYTMSCIVSTSDVTITGITVSKGQTSLSSWSSGTAEITNEDGIVGAINQAASETTFSVTFATIACEDDGEYFCEATQGDGIASSLKTRTFLTVTQAPLLKLPSTLVAGETTAYNDPLDCTATTEQGGSLKLQIYSSDSSSYEDFAIGQSILPDPVICSVEKISFRQITFDETYDNVNVRCATFDSNNTMISDDTQAIRFIAPPANCTSDADAYYKHPFDCYKYLRCTGARLYVSSCADSTQCPAINTVDNLFLSCSTSNCGICSGGK